LREALAVTGEKTITFSVGGIIWSCNDWDILEPGTIIAGETTPSPGITLAGATLRIRVHGVLARHIRVRVGDGPNGPDPDGRDAIGLSSGHVNEIYNVVLDHCSLSWAIDENMSFWNLDSHDNIVQDCIISECLQNSIHSEGEHSCGMLVGSHAQNATIARNLFAHNYRRNPCLVGDTSSVVVNNVVYNARMAIHSQDPENEGPMSSSIVGNVLLPGLDWAEPRIRLYDTVKEGSQVYIEDNIAPLPPRIDTAFNPLVEESPWWPGGLEVLSSDDVLDSVLANAGARPWDRDAIDQRIISDVKNGTGRIIDSQRDVGGWFEAGVGIRGVATWKSAEQGPAVMLDYGGRKIEFSHEDLIELDTAEELYAAANEIFGEDFPKPVFFHVNRDNTIAVATGAMPSVWPEDF